MRTKSLFPGGDELRFGGVRFKPTRMIGLKRAGVVAQMR
jgi:hypothetical protein